jgi:hypothetical protein
VILDAREHGKLDVGERADGQRHLLRYQSLAQRGILLAAHAMVDAHRLQQIERFDDVFRRTFLAGVRDGQESLGASAREHFGESGRRIPDLGGIQADAQIARRGTATPARASPSPRPRSGGEEAHDHAATSRPARAHLGKRAANPFTTVANAMPRPVCVCGSKKISAWTTPSARARRR